VSGLATTKNKSAAIKEIIIFVFCFGTLEHVHPRPGDFPQEQDIFIYYITRKKILKESKL